MADYVRRQAEALGLAVVGVDVEALARVPELVATQFESMLERVAHPPTTPGSTGVS